MQITEDKTGCKYGWGPCLDAYGFAHSCEFEEGHDDPSKPYHKCSVCGMIEPFTISIETMIEVEESETPEERELLREWDDMTEDEQDDARGYGYDDVE